MHFTRIMEVPPKITEMRTITRMNIYMITLITDIKTTDFPTMKGFQRIKWNQRI